MTSIIDKVTGFRSCLELMEKSQWDTCENLQDMQFRLARSIVTYSVQRVPYYAHLFSKAGLSADKIRDFDDFAGIPISTKATIRPTYPRGVYTRGSWLDMKTKTSGSSGDPFECVIDGRSHCWRIASRFLFDSWNGIDPGELWIRISGHPLPVERIRARVLGPEIVVPIEHTARSMFRLLISEIDRYRPAGLLGVPSSLALLSKHIQDTGIRPKHDFKCVVSTGETFPELQRKLISSTLSKNVFDRYGLREFGGYLAQDCERHQGLHTNSFLVYAEVLRNGHAAKPGELGRLILTDLRNYAMPLIRYDTGDSASIGVECECGRGFPILGSLMGRVNELIPTRFGLLPSYAVTDRFGLAFTKDLNAFQFIQLQDGAVVVKIVPTAAYDAKLRDRIAKFLNSYLSSFEVELVTEIRPDASGKRPIFKSTLSAV